MDTLLSREEVKHQMLNKDIFNLELRISEYAVKRDNYPLDSELHDYYNGIHKELAKFSTMLGSRVCSQPLDSNIRNALSRLRSIEEPRLFFQEKFNPTSQQIDEIETVENIRISENKIPHGIYQKNSSQSRESPTQSEMSFNLS